MGALGIEAEKRRCDKKAMTVRITKLEAAWARGCSEGAVCEDRTISAKSAPYLRKVIFRPGAI